MNKFCNSIATLFLLLFLPSIILAQEIEDAAKAAQNPLANIISLPLQNNNNFGISDYNKSSHVVNIQPIIPAVISKNGWLLINRLIIPLPYSVPDLSSESASNISGLGDISYTAWFAPPTKGKLTWGFGFTSIWPTAGKSELGQGKISVGPSFVFVYSTEKFMGAAVISNWTSVAGDEEMPDVNTFYFQYILTFFLQNKWYLSSGPINLANWEAESGEQWTVPLGGGFGKMFRAGNLPMDASTQLFYNVVTPTGGPTWQWRVQLKFIFPVRK
jgi:hypothetical protein